MCISLLFPFFSLSPSSSRFWSEAEPLPTSPCLARAQCARQSHAHTHSLGGGWRTFRCYATPDGGDGTPDVPEMYSDMSTVSSVLVEGKWGFGYRFLIVLARRNRIQNNSGLAKFTQDSQWNQSGFLLLLAFRE